MADQRRSALWITIATADGVVGTDRIVAIEVWERQREMRKVIVARS